MCLRAAAVLVGLLALCLGEAALTALGVGAPDDHDDPFVGFSSTRPLFVPSDDGARYEIPPGRYEFFRPDSFAAEKDPDEFRIFCLGGSTVQGRPFAIETSFTTWLELTLQAADPQRKWEVVNCGGVSYASYRLAPMLEEVLTHQPDYIILYTGHNEFLEDRAYAHLRRRPAALFQCEEWASRLHTYTLLREAYRYCLGESKDAAHDVRPLLNGEVSAILDYRGGLSEYHRDKEQRKDIIEHFAFNLRRMVRLCREAGVPLLLVNPVCNLRDCPPFKSEHRAGLSPEDLARWEKLRAQASENYKNNKLLAISQLQKALAIDDEYAGLHYDMAKCWDALGDMEKAKIAYIQAKESDICPLRILEPMNEAVLRTARRAKTPLVDAKALIERRSPGGIASGYLLVDHVHPSIKGHQLIAEAIAEEFFRRGVATPASGWREARDRAFQKQMDSLDDLYFVEGEHRLKNLRGWAAGRSTLAPPSDSASSARSKDSRAG